MPPKNTGKSLQKGAKGEKQKHAKENNQKRWENFDTYIKKLPMTIYPDATLSPQAMNILCSLMNYIFERIATEATLLAFSQSFYNYESGDPDCRLSPISRRPS